MLCRGCHLTICRGSSGGWGEGGSGPPFVITIVKKGMKVGNPRVEPSFHRYKTNEEGKKEAKGKMDC